MSFTDHDYTGINNPFFNEGDFLDADPLDFDEKCVDLFGDIKDLDGYERVQTIGRVREINMNFIYLSVMDGLPFPIYAFIRRLEDDEVTFSVFDSEHPSRDDWETAGFFTLRDTDFLECFKPVGYVHYRLV